MIANPKVGQRVVVYDVDGLMHLATVVAINDGAAQVRVMHDPIGDFESPPIWAEYRDCFSDAAALRAEAQRLLDAADKLEAET